MLIGKNSLETQTAPKPVSIVTPSNEDREDCKDDDAPKRSSPGLSLSGLLLSMSQGEGKLSHRGGVWHQMEAHCRMWPSQVVSPSSQITKMLSGFPDT